MDLSQWFVNTAAFQPNQPVETSFTLPSGATFTPSNISGTPGLSLNDPDLGGGFGTAPVNSAGIGANQNANPFTGSSSFPGVSFSANNPFGPSVVTGTNNANLSTPIVPSGGQTLAGTTPDSGGGATGLGGDAQFSFNSPVEAQPSSGNAGSNPLSTVDPFGNIISADALPNPLGTTGSGVANLIPGLGPLAGILGGVGGAAVQSATGNTAGATGDFFGTAAATAWNFAQRFGLVILAIVLIGVGAFWLAHHPDTVRAIRRVRGHA